MAREVVVPSRVVAAAAVAALLFLGGAVGFVVAKGQDPGAGSVDAGFLFDMISHHEQAVEMAKIELARGGEPGVQVYAREIAIQQQYEIGRMESFLEDWGHQRTRPPERAMRWMNMNASRGGMPGMATHAEMHRLAASSGRDADALFIALMTEHHEGGIHMAQYASEHAKHGKIRRIARSMAAIQRSEIAEMEQARVRFGLPKA